MSSEIVHDPEAFVEAIESVDGVVTTHAVVREIECTYPTAVSRLYDLADEGRVERREVAGVIVWSLSDR